MAIRKKTSRSSHDIPIFIPDRIFVKYVCYVTLWLFPWLLALILCCPYWALLLSLLHLFFSGHHRFHTLPLKLLARRSKFMQHFPCFTCDKMITKAWSHAISLVMQEKHRCSGTWLGIYWQILSTGNMSPQSTLWRLSKPAKLELKIYSSPEWIFDCLPVQVDSPYKSSSNFL